MTEASSELEQVEPFESADQDSVIKGLSERSVTIHDDIEDLIMGCGHSEDEELVDEATQAAKLQAEAHVLAMQVS